jgi:hypothetical protein
MVLDSSRANVSDALEIPSWPTTERTAANKRRRQNGARDIERAGFI